MVISPERKEAVLKKLLPPLNRSVTQLTAEEGISEQRFYNRRNQLKAQRNAVPVSGQKPDDWSGEAKLAVVIETAPLSEPELSQYCREKGMLVEQVKEWRCWILIGPVSPNPHREIVQVQAAA